MHGTLANESAIMLMRVEIHSEITTRFERPYLLSNGHVVPNLDLDFEVLADLDRFRHLDLDLEWKCSHHLLGDGRSDAMDPADRHGLDGPIAGVRGSRHRSCQESVLAGTQKNHFPLKLPRLSFCLTVLPLKAHLP